MKAPHAILFLAVATSLFVAGCQSGGEKAAEPTSPPTGGAAASVAFAEIQPILQKNCAGCHGAQPKEGYDVRTHESIMKGGEDGPLVKAGDPKGSLLVQVLRGQEGHPQMPPSGAISAGDIEKIEAWIQAGAKG